MRTRVITFRLLVTMLVAMAAVSVSAQDSYREAVKEYLSATDAMENAKSFMPALSMMFESDGQVDVEQLTKRYFDDQLENYMIDNSMSKMKALGLTELDIKLVASMLGTPQGKAFQAHWKDWFINISKFMSMPLLKMMERYSKPEEERGPYEHFEPWPGFLDGATVQPKAEIDEAYAAKFNDVIIGSDFVKDFLDVMKKRMKEDSAITMSGITTPETEKEIVDRVVNALPTILLNSAYGVLTPEDIDYAATIFNIDAYNKLQIDLNTEGNGASQVGLNFVEWMQEQGAKMTEDPEVIMNFYKMLLNIGD